MELIKKIIREELEKVLNTLDEIDFRESITSVKNNPKDNIIYDYDAGKTFGGDTLGMDIPYLNSYNLVEYLPKSEEEENWSFEYYTVNGTILIVDVIRKIGDNDSFWSLRFGQLYKDEKYPTLIAEIKNIQGYDNFVNIVTRHMGEKMNPSKF